LAAAIGRLQAQQPRLELDQDRRGTFLPHDSPLGWRQTGGVPLHVVQQLDVPQGLGAVAVVALVGLVEVPPRVRAQQATSTTLPPASPA